MKSFLFLVVCIPSFAFGQLTLSGKVVHQESQKPIENVHVVIAGYSIGTVTNDEGSFEIEAQGNTEVIFTALGYDTLRLTTDSAAKISLFLLKPAIYELDEVIASDAERLRAFKEKILDKKPTETKRPEITQEKESPPPPPGKGPPPGLDNPVEYLYEMFSDKAKEKREWEKIEAWDEKVSYWEERLSQEDLSVFFGLDPEEQPRYWLMIRNQKPQSFENQIEMLKYLRMQALFFGQTR